VKYRRRLSADNLRNTICHSLFHALGTLRRNVLSYDAKFPLFLIMMSVQRSVSEVITTGSRGPSAQSGCQRECLRITNWRQTGLPTGLANDLQPLPSLSAGRRPCTSSSSAFSPGPYCCFQAVVRGHLTYRFIR
jgi:hypothetical protein